MHYSNLKVLALLSLAPLSWQLDLQTPLSPDSAPTSPPSLGFGTWNLRTSAENTTNAVAHAIKTGYRHIDCAAAYSNEVDVGRGIKEGLTQVSGLSRQDLWITSKLWNDHHGSYETVEKGLNQTLLSLGQEYLDLYLMHWPVGNTNGTYTFDYLETWESMEKLLNTGRVRNIGICNFSPAQLTDLLANSAVKPHSHQMELHPYLQQSDFVDWHYQKDIHVIAYSPLGNTNPTYSKKKHTPPLLENGYMQRIAKKQNATPAQVSLAWGMGRGVSVIPKSSHAVFIEENFGSLNVKLARKDLKRIKKVGKRYLTRFNNPGDGWGVHLFEGLDGA